MGKYVEYPKWKYAKGASEIDRPRSVMVANADQEAALDGEWFDTPNFTNNEPSQSSEASESAIPAGYEPVEYPKWVYNESVPGGRLIHNRGEQDAVEQAYPGTWSDKPTSAETPQLKAFGLPEDTGHDPNDPLMASDPLKLDKQASDNAAAAADERNRLQTEQDRRDANKPNTHVSEDDPVDDSEKRQKELDQNTIEAAELDKTTPKDEAVNKNAAAAKAKGHEKAPKKPSSDEDLL